MSAAVNLQVRGSMYYPSNLGKPARSSCSCTATTAAASRAAPAAPRPNCTIFNRNDLGYSYLAENLATWGYAVASIDQDQLMSFQDNGAKGMHQRRLMIAAQLDALYARREAPVPADADHNLGDSLVGKLDFSRIGLMGQLPGGDAVTSFMDSTAAAVRHRVAATTSPR